MKVVLQAAAAAMLFVTAATAQTTTPAPAVTPAPAADVVSSCATFGEAPVLPDGATATREVVAAAELAYQAWSEQARVAVACRRAEYDATVVRARALQDQHNAEAARLNAVTTAWGVERGEFCARPRMRCGE
jgi:hypothetical protein